MYIDLITMAGEYRGMSREFELEKIAGRGLWSRKGREYWAIFDKYLEWQSKMDNTYSDSVLQMLTSLRDEHIKRGGNCEIILYSDNPEEFQLGEGFLGFDVYWDEEGVSGIESRAFVAERFFKQLNENGLFASYEAAPNSCAAS